MNGALVALISLVLFGLGYWLYGSYLAETLLELDPSRPTPAHRLNDGIDYVPSNRWVLFGHHFASIAGLGPILGPAIAVIWGWLPAVMWVVFGSILMGAVHDFTTLGLSIRNDGRSVGDIASSVMNERARLLFLVLIFFLISLAMGVFAYVIAILFASLYPETVVPIVALMAIAIVMGILTRYGFMGLTPASIGGFALLMVALWWGVQVEPVQLGLNSWVYLLMGYAFVASVLPVWLLLQPRDYLNAFLLVLGLVFMYGGLFVLRPEISAPAINRGAEAPTDLPMLFPLLFITIACGAISGFHSLVSSGTSAKQLDSEEDAQLVGYGSMISEGILALIVILACVAGLGGAEVWHERYASWGGAKGLQPQLQAFIDGGATFLVAIAGEFGLTKDLGRVFISLIAVSFAMTTLDSGTRLLRYNIEELAATVTDTGTESLPVWSRIATSGVAVVAVGFFALLEVPTVQDGDVSYEPAGLFLWVLFGASNQLLAALGLLLVSVFLYQVGRPVWYTLLPMVFMLVATVTALFIQLVKQMPSTVRGYLPGMEAVPHATGSWVLFLLVIGILVLSGWFIWEAWLTYRRQTG